ncbi:hypothetical protein NKH18_38045 [Streptomyces sp. M10(2022)]
MYRRGAGLSTFISAGNRADVSGNDFLQYWFDDQDTDVALLYLESLGNPRKFTRLARRTATVKPVVVVKGARHSGSTPPGHAVPVSRIPEATVSALMRQAGVIRVDTVTEMVDVGLLLADQPLPAGPGSRSSATPSRSACSPTTPASPKGCARVRRVTSPPARARRTSGTHLPRPWPTRPATR